MIAGIDLGTGVEEIKKYVSDMNFPADKQQIVQHAKEKNAPSQVTMILEKIPDQVYQSVDNLMEKVKGMI